MNLRQWRARRKRYLGRVRYLQGRRVIIIGTYGDIVGGVILDQYIDGFRSWNLEDLRTRP